ILKRLQGSAEYDRMNVKEPSRILIHGPNRTGKSSLVHAFAIEAKLPFFVVQGKEIEKNPPMIVSLFSEARVSSPSIIYIEGIEVITSTGVSQILYEMESCENDRAAFVVIGTAWCECGVKGLITYTCEASSKQETIVRKGRQARVGKQELASKSRQGRSKKQEARSKKQEARSKKQEARSKKQEGERKQVEKGDKQQERKERSRKQEKFSKNFEQVDPVIGGVLRGGRIVKDGVSDQACSGDHKKASSKDCSFVCMWLCKQEEKQRLIGKNEQPALLNEVINLWLSVEVYRVKLWKDIQNAPEHYMAKLNQVLDPLLTSKDAPEHYISNEKALDDVIDMGRRLDAFTKSVKVGGAGKKPIIVSRLIKIIIEYWMVNLKWDLKQISIEKWTVKLIGGVGKSATRSLKNTTNGREKGLKLRILKRLQGSVEYDRMNLKVPFCILVHDPNRTDVTKTLKDTKYRISMLEEKDATRKEYGTIVVSSCIALVVASTSSFGYNHDFNSTSAHWASLLRFVNLNVLVFLIMQGTNRQMTILFYKINIKTVVNGSRSHIRSKKR
ncbi:ATPase, AAA-type, core, P-loop containing nucleoside triphosphate hydrolase, partial [Tanacetum coccineum]